MPSSDALDRGRLAHDQRQWTEAHACLSLADRGDPLDADDLGRLAEAAYLLGNDEGAAATWQRAHQAAVQAGSPERSARWAFWLSFTFLLRGEPAQSAGWLSRAQRLLEDRSDPCVERGYLEFLDALRTMAAGDAARARGQFETSTALARRFQEPDLMALSLLGLGQATIEEGHAATGTVLLDEAMVAITADQVSPIAVGIVYCAVISTCQHTYDLRRAQEWTAALDLWCAAQPELVAFRGQCLVHRSEVLQLRAHWVEALEQATSACERLRGRARGRAHYQRGEIHRLRGDMEAAEAAYLEAARLGHEPQPGMALLRRMQGKLQAAAAGIRRALIEAGDRPGPGGRPSRALFLGPCVEIMLAVNDMEAARSAARELSEITNRLDAPFLHATSQQATGSIRLAEGDASGALEALREAWTRWQKLEAAYDSGKARRLIAEACRRLGDTDAAQIHLDAARAVFERLGAIWELARLDEQPASTQSEPTDRLTSREREVLSRVATGQTNREIADELCLSEHTIARHLSNIFNKLGVSSRTAASAFARSHRPI